MVVVMQKHHNQLVDMNQQGWFGSVSLSLSPSVRDCVSHKCIDKMKWKKVRIFMAAAHFCNMKTIYWTAQHKSLLLINKEIYSKGNVSFKPVVHIHAETEKRNFHP
jgi:hypothetical protein